MTVSHKIEGSPVYLRLGCSIDLTEIEDDKLIWCSGTQALYDSGPPPPCFPRAPPHPLLSLRLLKQDTSKSMPQSMRSRFVLPRAACLSYPVQLSAPQVGYHVQILCFMGTENMRRVFVARSIVTHARSSNSGAGSGRTTSLSHAEPCGARWPCEWVVSPLNQVAEREGFEPSVEL